MRFLRLTTALAVAVALGGCDDEEEPAVTICRDYADVVATAFTDCELGTYEENLQAFEEALPAPCSQAVAIRDEGELADVCWPFFREASCDTLMDPGFADLIPPECRGQILFPE